MLVPALKLALQRRISSPWLVPALGQGGSCALCYTPAKLIFQLAMAAASTALLSAQLCSRALTAAAHARRPACSNYPMPRALPDWCALWPVGVLVSR